MVKFDGSGPDGFYVVCAVGDDGRLLGEVYRGRGLGALNVVKGRAIKRFRVESDCVSFLIWYQPGVNDLARTPRARADR